MIPTLILAGLVVGLFPRPWLVVGMVIAAVAWPLLLAATGPAETVDLASMAGEFLLAAVNIAAGTLVMRKLVGLVQAFR